MTVASITGGTIIGLAALAVTLGACVVAFLFGWSERHRAYGDGWLVWAAPLVAVLTVGGWWWGMAFTTSGDYHAWNERGGTVQKVSKRLVSNGDSGMSERYVLQIDGQPYGVDDTRAALVKPGERVSLKCKKDYQWGVPREAHGWACRWNGVAS